RVEKIRKAKFERSLYLTNQLNFNQSSVVLEIGSGAGFTTKHIAPKVKSIHCYDISGHFLDIAQRECQGLSNVSFQKGTYSDQKLPYEGLFFDAIFSDAV